MNDWTYAREESPRLAPGDYRVSIVDAQEAISKTSGNPMLVITIQPNGFNTKIQNYIVMNEYFNRNMTQFFDAFPQIQEGDFNILGWVGCIGAARIKEDEKGYMKVAFFIDEKRAEKLPPWEGALPERQTVNELTGFTDVTDEELPF